MSPALRALFNRWRRRLLQGLKGRMVFGERSQGRLLPHTRIAPSARLEHEERLTLGDHVYIGPFCLVEASAGLVIEEGVQITSHVSIVTHSSHRAQRLLGAAYAGWVGDKPAWIAGPVHIGAYSFVGPHSLIEAGSHLGRGCIVRAGSVVRGSFPEFSVIEGRPARVVGDARDGDRAALRRHPQLQAHYDAWAGTAAPPPAP